MVDFPASSIYVQNICFCKGFQSDISLNLEKEEKKEKKKKKTFFIVFPLTECFSGKTKYTCEVGFLFAHLFVCFVECFNSV